MRKHKGTSSASFIFYKYIETQWACLTLKLRTVVFEDTCCVQKLESHNMNKVSMLRSHLSRQDYTLLQSTHHKSTHLQEAFFFCFPKHVCLCVWPNAPQYSEETAAWVCVGWKGQSLQITSDFSDRKLGKNLRKLLSRPAQTKKK